MCYLPLDLRNVMQSSASENSSMWLTDECWERGSPSFRPWAKGINRVEVASGHLSHHEERACLRKKAKPWWSDARATVRLPEFHEPIYTLYLNSSRLELAFCHWWLKWPRCICWVSHVSCKYLIVKSSKSVKESEFGLCVQLLCNMKAIATVNNTPAEPLCGMMTAPRRGVLQRCPREGGIEAPQGREGGATGEAQACFSAEQESLRMELHFSWFRELWFTGWKDLGKMRAMWEQGRRDKAEQVGI